MIIVLELGTGKAMLQGPQTAANTALEGKAVGVQRASTSSSFSRTVWDSAHRDLLITIWCSEEYTCSQLTSVKSWESWENSFKVEKFWSTEREIKMKSQTDVKWEQRHGDYQGEKGTEIERHILELRDCALAKPHGILSTQTLMEGHEHKTKAKVSS